MEVLHQSNYDMNLATGKLVPRGPVLCSDELESWTQGTHMAHTHTHNTHIHAHKHTCMYQFLTGLFLCTLEEAKKFEDGLQEAKDFFNIQRKHVRMYVCCVYRGLYFVL